MSGAMRPRMEMPGPAFERKVARAAWVWKTMVRWSGKAPFSMAGRSRGLGFGRSVLRGMGEGSSAGVVAITAGAGGFPARIFRGGMASWVRW